MVIFFTLVVCASFAQRHPSFDKDGQPPRDKILVQEYEWRALLPEYGVPNAPSAQTSKAAALKATSFINRLVLSANFHIITLHERALDFCLGLGYQVTPRFLAGGGGSYRNTYGKRTSSFCPELIGYKTFAHYDLLSNFFAYGEFARNSPGRERSIGGESTVVWKNALLTGIGKRMAIRKNIDMTLIVACNILPEYRDAIYPGNLVVRLGFQSNALTFKKSH
ncbi:MAG TPA: hypothetical protein VD816_05540 [Ohtaekwangia sp.]|nr:hypothetical protein [Ohtaekwangia sp.]